MQSIIYLIDVDQQIELKWASLTSSQQRKRKIGRFMIQEKVYIICSTNIPVLKPSFV